MGGAETAGIVIVTVAIIQGLLALVKYIINKNKIDSDQSKLIHIVNKLDVIEDKVGSDCGLNDTQAQYLHDLHQLHTKFDADGTPIWYVPRSWAETQKDIVDKLIIISEVNMKMLVLIERLERKLLEN